MTAIGDVGFLASIPLWLVTLLGCLAITVLAFLMILTVYGRFFRLYLYAALSPVALASFAGEGTSQMGRAFLKSYMGVCLEGAVIVLACIVFSAFAASDTVVLGGRLGSHAGMGLFGRGDLQYAGAGRAGQGCRPRGTGDVRDVR